MAVDTKKEFVELYESVRLRLYAFLLASLRNRNDADELHQEVGMVLWENFDRYDPTYDFGAWTFGIARNKIREYMRARGKMALIGEDFYDQLAVFAQTGDDDSDLRLEALAGCVKKLNMGDRKLLLMRYKREFKVSRISEITGRSENGLYKSLARIVMLLRSCMRSTLRRQEAGY
ncbi:MAG: sigma-70 family RNA polymerase sigma factor [Phycisphaerae bacterium]